MDKKPDEKTGQKNGQKTGRKNQTKMDRKTKEVSEIILFDVRSLTDTLPTFIVYNLEWRQ